MELEWEGEEESVSGELLEVLKFGANGEGAEGLGSRSR